MSLPDWLADSGRFLDTGATALADLRSFLSVVAPGPPGRHPIAIEQTVDLPGGARSWIGTARLWDSDQARFGVSAGLDDRPSAIWVAKPLELVELLTEALAPVGVSTGTFWMVLSATVSATAWDLGDGGPPLLPMTRHLVGTVDIAGRRQLVRLGFDGDAVTATVDFTGSASEVERAAMGGDPGNLDGLTFGDLVGLFGNEHEPHADLAWLPEPLRDPDLFTLDELRFRVDPADEDVLVAVHARVGLAERTMWHPVPGFDAFGVGHLRVTFAVDHPLDAAIRTPRVTVDGDIAIGTATIAASARWPDLAVEGHLVDGDSHPIDLNEVLGAMHVPELAARAPKVDALSLSLHPTGQYPSFSARLRISDVLTLPIGSKRLEVRSVDVEADLGAAADRSLAVRITGELHIGDVALALRAQSDHGAQGWTLRAETVERIPLADLEGWLQNYFVPEPFPPNVVPSSAAISELSVQVHTASTDVALHLATSLPLSGPSPADLTLDLNLAHSGGGRYERRLGGRLSIGNGHRFDLEFASTLDPSDPTSAAGRSMLVGAYQQDGKATIADLAGALGVNLPLPIVLTDALLAHGNGMTLVVVDLHEGFDLSGLPVVGSLLTGDRNVSLELRVAVASGGWDATAVTALNSVLPQGYAPLQLADPGGGRPPSLASPSLSATLSIGSTAVHLPDLGVGLTPSAASSPAAPPPASTSGPAPLPLQVSPQAKDDVTWVPLQKGFGPLFARQAGVRLDAQARTITVLLDAEVRLGGLTLSLDGLGVTNPIDRVSPSFTLRGLGLDLRLDSLAIGGAFLRVGDHEYAGAASLRLSSLSLAALGAYGEVNGHRSLFIYAVLDYPLGGPAFFFVTGLAAGFGYNRRLVMPAIDGIADFPLVREAVAGTAKAALPVGDVLSSKLAALEAFVPPSDGDLFFALGVRFSTFNLLDSFVLLAVSIGTTVRIDALGLSTLVVPRPESGASVTPLAEVQIALHAQIVPAEGFVGVEARLTPASFVLSRQCHLSGGAALYSWFSGPHAGDFIVTVGGYHPSFVRPDHYPDVPRLAFEWQVTPEVALKGSLYFALAAHALMAGGALEATYNSGAVSAWFRAGIDFLIAWQPYHYDAHAYINVGARWHSIEAELGVDLHVWGPDFAGRAEIDLVLTSFTVEFGASRAPTPQPLDWAKFGAASLPPSSAMCTISCQRGMVRQLEPGPGLAGDWVVGSHDLVLVVASQIPSTGYQVNSGVAQPAPGVAPALGVAPMAVPRGQLDSQLHLTINLVDGSSRTPIDMAVIPVLKSVPAALWGDAEAPKVNDERTIAGALSGFELRPTSRPSAATELTVARSDIGWTDVSVYRPLPSWLAPARSIGRLDEQMPGAQAELGRKRADILRGIGVDPGRFRPGPEPMESFLAPPRIVRFERSSA